MTSYITMKKDTILHHKTNVAQMVKVGDPIKTGEPLITFEPYVGEDDISAMLDSLGDLGMEVQKLSKNYLKSKYTGVIEDIKIYYTVPEEELSPSLRKIITEYNANINKKKSIIDKYHTEENPSGIILPPSEQVIPVNGKVKGVEVGDGVLIEFYVKYEDVLGIGKFIAA